MQVLRHVRKAGGAMQTAQGLHVHPHPGENVSVCPDGNILLEMMSVSNSNDWYISFPSPFQPVNAQVLVQTVAKLLNADEVDPVVFVSLLQLMTRHLSRNPDSDAGTCYLC